MQLFVATLEESLKKKKPKQKKQKKRQETSSERALKRGRGDQTVSQFDKYFIYILVQAINNMGRVYSSVFGALNTT